MKKAFFNCKYFFFVMIFFSFLFYLSNSLAVEDSLPVLSIESNAIPLKEFIDQVSKESGYKISVSEELLTLSITGSFANINLEQLFHKIFRKHNVFQIIDTGKKEILIYTDLKDTDKVYASQPQSVKKNKNLTINLNQLEIYPGKTLGEVRRERDEFARKINNNEIIVDGDGGSTYSERKEARKQLENQIKNEKIIVEVGQGRTLQDVQATRKKLEEKISAGNIPMDTNSQLTLAEVRKRRAELERKIRTGEIVITEDRD